MPVDQTSRLIAIIDDDEAMQDSLRDLMEAAGLVARCFASAEEYISADGGCSCDCVITDINMPGMSGLDLKRLLVSRDCRVPVIMITAQAESGLDAKAAATGAICLLRKPFESKALISCLEKALAP